MATKIVKTEDSSGAALIAILLVVLLLTGVVLYNRGYFGGNDTDINVQLPNGKSISADVN